MENQYRGIKNTKKKGNKTLVKGKENTDGMLIAIRGSFTDKAD